MRTSSRWLACLLIAVMLFSVPAMAAGESPISLSGPEQADVGETVEITVRADEADVVADGKLTVTYDAEALTYVETTLGDGWKVQADVVWSVNDKTAGKVIVAFASVEASDAGELFVLTFEGKADADAEIGIGGGSYVTGGDGDTEYTDLEETLEVQIGDGGEDGGLVVPDRPAPDMDDGEACDGGEDCPSGKFVDVNYTGDFHEGIDFMVENGYMAGVSDTEFAPTTSMNRAMMVTILYRLEGKPAYSVENPFTDVQEGVWYYDAVLWALENGITTGISDTEFAPNSALTREQIATFLYRYAQFAGMDTSASASLTGYTDAGQVSAYAVPAMEWAVGSGIVNGTSATTLSPKANAQRVQIAVMVWRLLK